MRHTIDSLKAHKNKDQALVVLTAYTTPMAEIISPYVDCILVGDSLGMVLYGMENTLGVDMEMMIRHGQAVMRTNPDTPVIIDMPYGSYEDSKEKALENAQRILDETGAQAIKLEGGQDMEETIAHLVTNGIAVMGHIGLQPQSVEKEGGYKVKGKTPESAQKIMDDAKAVERAGAFAVVIEGTVDDLAAEITKEINIPTIGIGASLACDGQVLVSEDMLGLFKRTAKFVSPYADLRHDIASAAKRFSHDVKTRQFPTQRNIYKKAS